MKKILVTGANGQLAKCIADAEPNQNELDFYYTTRNELDIENQKSIADLLDRHSFQFCVNTAAYTNVEQSELHPDIAYAINAEGVKNLAEECKKRNIVLIHISTDYVFDGLKMSPYNESDDPNPINEYGRSKLEGEKHIESICKSYFIIRSSWLYSKYENNFYNTVIRNARLGKEMSITTEQTGTPTNANDLAEAIIRVISSNSSNYGLFHFSNSGSATWYDFAEGILRFTNELENTKLVKTDHYRTFAKRPKYSVLDSAKFCRIFDHNTVDWKESVYNLTQKYNNT